ncbi:mechanosensitive ion channel domain-containing protein [Pontimicrobium sp. MEBiC01747]|jgi:small-conductance mechanosensitive channel
METFLKANQNQLVYTVIVFVVFFIIRFAARSIVRKIGRNNGVNEARIGLINRYTTATLLIIFILIEAYVFGAEIKDLTVIFSSLFAVIGIALFAIWSILSNVTTGIIMFFSFPYKVGDKIKIHDKDYPIEAIIEDIRAFQLHLRLDNGDLVTYPNNLILQKAVTLIKKDAIDDGSSAI